MATKKKPAPKKKAPAKKAARKPAPNAASVKRKPAPLNPPKLTIAKLKPLNDQQTLFVSEYLKDRKRAPAAVRAGYSEKTADQIAYQLLQNPSIRAAIDEGMEALLTDNGLTAARTIREIARLAYFDPAKMYDKNGRLLPVDKMDEDTRAAIVSVEVEGTRTSKTGQTARVRYADKAAALRMAAQHHGLLKERLELTGKDGGPIETRELSDAERAVRLANLLAKAAARAKAK